jgi:hypothetical protein
MYIPHSVKITVCIGRTIVIDNDVDTLNINTTSEDIGGNQNTLFECFEGGVSADPVKLH